jgi:hypothetical protein
LFDVVDFLFGRDDHGGGGWCLHFHEVPI